MNLVNKLNALFHNPVCWSCGLMHESKLLICEHCLYSIKKVQQPCLMCGLTQASQYSLCVRCVLKPKLWQHMLAPLSYQAPTSHLIQQLKYQQNLGVLQALMDLALPAFKSLSNKPDLLIPVPLHKSRYIQRGFNQSFEITLMLSKALDIPFSHQLARRVLNTPRQSGLKLKHRESNIKNAFVVDKAISQYQHVAIVDDVITSTSTVHELAKSCLKMGVKTLDVWALARTEFER